MAASTGDLERPLGGLLPAYIFAVDCVMLGFAEERVSIDLNRSDAIPGIHEVDHVEQRFHRVDSMPPTIAASVR